MFSGQILTRTFADRSGADDKIKPGHVLVAFVGLMQVPEDSPLNSEGKMFAIGNNEIMDTMGPMMPGHHTLHVQKEPVGDFHDRMRGETLGNALTMPIWRL